MSADAITVEAAVKTGLRWVNTPVYVIMFGGWIGAIWLVGVFAPALSPASPATAAPYVAALVTPYVSAWLWWSLAIPRWRLWALERVEDWPRLRAAAIEAKLIWAETTPLQRRFAATEIWTKAQRLRLEQLRAARGETGGSPFNQPTS
ncbi:MAG TPA: hypothetical protein VEA80_14165 [Vitreimonas sp.]|uniref:hypothetical protein n=1 Tax=Vitreimonas sp. TaxID=3069702 RepID=UPI002D43666C|nr:hypothetical protein [Vitreimonas sp.]HYD88615.1 hypothetical protein [Vitreimonas sp.]